MEDSETSTPITKELLEKVLKKKLVSFKATGGSNIGDNYMSILIALEILPEGQTEPLHLLFKTFPHHPTRQKLLEDSNTFLKEFQVYDQWLPELVNFQKSLGNEELVKPAMPELVAGAAIDYTSDPNSWSGLDPMQSNFLLMVDVRKTYGFQMVSKLRSLDYHQVTAVMEELAKYHALGYAYKTHKGLPNIRGKFACMEDFFYTKPSQRPTMEAVMKARLQIVFDACKDWLDSKPEIAKSLKKFEDPALAADYFQFFLNPEGFDEEKAENLMRVKPSNSPLKEQWIVASHGDCWTNNLLFKQDENGKATEVVIVDLQIAMESDIMSDLVYFLYSSTDTKFREKYLDEMLKIYCNKFVKTCDALQVKPFPGFSVENFLRKFQRSKLLGFLFASILLPVILQKPETTVNLDSAKVGEGDSESNDPNKVAEFFSNMGRDEDDQKMLRDRFTELFVELYEQGIL